MKRTGSYLAIPTRQPLIARPSRAESRTAVSPPAIQLAFSRGSCSVMASSGSSSSSTLVVGGPRMSQEPWRSDKGNRPSICSPAESGHMDGWLSTAGFHQCYHKTYASSRSIVNPPRMGVVPDRFTGLTLNAFSDPAGDALAWRRSLISCSRIAQSWPRLRPGGIRPSPARSNSSSLNWRPSSSAIPRRRRPPPRLRCSAI
jgi:hypothetical protein